MLHSSTGAGVQLGRRQQGIRHAHARLLVRHAASTASRPARQRCLRPVQASAGLEHLLLDSTLPVLKIGAIASVGAISAHHGLLGADVRRALSQLAINVFTPALMITKLAPHTDLASALSLWYIGANVILCHFAGLALGVLHTRMLPTPPDLQRIIQATSSIANTGNLPLVLVLSLIKSPDLPFNSPAQADMAVSYIMLGLLYATLVQMPLGTLLLHKPREQQTGSAAASQANGSSIGSNIGSSGDLRHDVTVHAQANALQASPALQQQLPGAAAQHLYTSSRPPASWQLPLQPTAQLTAGVPVSWSAYRHLEVPRAASPVAVLERLPTCTHADVFSREMQLTVAAQQWGRAGSSNSSNNSSSSGPKQVYRQAAQQAGALLWKDLDCRTASQLSAVAAPPQQQHLLQQQQQLSLTPLPQQQQQADCWQQQWEDVGRPLMKGVLSAPMLAGVAAIMIGSCPPLQQALFSPRGSLSFVGDVLDMLGQPLIPVLLLVLGANLSNGPQLESGAHLPVCNVAGVLFTKLLLSPLLGLGVVLGAQKASLLGQHTDPLVVLVMMVAWATPTAVLVHSLALVHKNGEDEVSALLFYEYIAAALTLPLCSAMYLYVLGCCVPRVA